MVPREAIVAGAKALLFLVGQAPYDAEGRAAHPGDFFGRRGPASTMVEVSSLSHPDYMIEVEAIALI